MKKQLAQISILCLFVTFIACKKQSEDTKLKCYEPGLTCYHFDTSEITQTDYRGHIIGIAQPNQWTLQPISEASDSDRNVFKQIYGLNTGDNNQPDLINFHLNNYNQNCVMNDAQTTNTTKTDAVQADLYE